MQSHLPPLLLGHKTNVMWFVLPVTVYFLLLCASCCCVLPAAVSGEMPGADIKQSASHLYRQLIYIHSDTHKHTHTRTHKHKHTFFFCMSYECLQVILIFITS